MANRKGTPESLGVTPLAEGEHSRPVRVRAESWVFEALKGRSAAEVGALLASALHPAVNQVEQDSGQPTALHAPVTAAPSVAVPNLPKPLLDIVASLEVGCTAQYDYGVRKWVVSGKGQWYEVIKGELTKLVKAGLIQEEVGVYRVTR